MTPTMHGKDWSGENVAGWFWSEKFDGWRALWDGQSLWTRQGIRYDAPDWWLAALPGTPLDGELYLPGGTHTDVQRMEWGRLQFRAFDVPVLGTTIEDAISAVEDILPMANCIPVNYGKVINADHARQLMRYVCACGGEGIMLRKPGSAYENGRTGNLLKLKPKTK